MEFPYGIADFRKIREIGYFYINHTNDILRRIATNTPPCCRRLRAGLAGVVKVRIE
ncbi:MAG: hypothetical protein KDI50_02995 [Candidatus Competibacteraceae bacterium]|nr:hypothetical protein [Candidatus Competibacteraceae bacterium]